MKDLKYLYEFEKLLESANNPLVQQACAEGKHALAYTCYHMPEVLLNTGDCFSVRLRAPLTGSLDISSYYMSNFICDYCKSLLERGIEGGYNFLSALLATETCSEMNRALEHFELLHLVDNEQFFVTFLDMPFKVTDNTVRHYVDQLRRKVLEPLHEVYGVDEEVTVKCSNYIGDTIDDAKLLGMKGILFIGHIGKFVKLAAGVMNTHSRQADCRMEVLAVHAALEGADSHTVRSVMDCVNTSEALRVLKECGLLEKVMESVMERIEFYLTNRAGEALDIAAVVFSNEEGVLGKTSKADSLFEQTSRFVRQKKGR